jgi:hypothetical protein
MERPKIKINSITKLGNIDTRRIFPQDYEETRKEFFLNRSIILPRSNEITLDENCEWRILLAPVHIYLHTNDGLYSYIFKEGFITDFASVPKIFRAAIDNDELDVIIAALVHDANFAYKLLGPDERGFRKANNIFRQMVNLSSHNKLKSFLMWLGVSSPIGKKQYRTYSKKDKYLRIDFRIL